MTATPGSTPKNVVLVHGGFVDGSGWEGVIPRATQGRLPGQHCPESNDLSGRRCQRDQARPGVAERSRSPGRPLVWRGRYYRGRQ
jgi:hypothetical protein